MCARIIAGPAEPVVSLDEARTAARVNGTDMDSEIMIRVNALAAEAEHVIGQFIINRTFEVTLPGFPARIPAPALPFGSVVEILYRDVDGAEQTLSDNMHTVDYTHAVPAVIPADGFVWPVTKERSDAVKIIVVIGYGADSSSTPPAFKGYILAKVREYFAPAGAPESPFLIRGLDSLKVYQ